MKIIIILLISAFSNIPYPGYSQRITYTGEGVPLKVIFSVIQKQTGFGFFYDKKLLGIAKPVSLSVKNASLSAVLKLAFKSQPLEYSIENKTIVVSGKKETTKPLLKQIAKANSAPQQLPEIDTVHPQKTDSLTVVKTYPPIDTLSKNIGNITQPLVKESSQGFVLSNDKKSVPALSDSGSLKSPSFVPKLFAKEAFAPIDYKKVTFGVKGGLTASRAPGWPSGSGSKDFYLGLFADKQMTSKFNLETEFTFALMGSTIQFEIPLHLKYHISNRWLVMAGPKFDYMGPVFGFGNIGGLSLDAGAQYQINQIFFAEARYSQRLISQDKNAFRLGIGANFSRNEAIESRADKPEPLRLRFGLNGGIATTSDYGAVMGFDFRIQENFTSFASGTLTAGFSHYSRDPGYIEYQNFFPVKMGLKLFPTNLFYLAPEAGFAFGLDFERDTRPIIYAGGIGAQLKNGFDLSFRYEKISGQMGTYYMGMPVVKNPGYFAVRAEYGVNFRSVGNKSGEFREGKEPPAWRGTHKKAVYLELGGHGLEYSANFDMRLKRDRNDGLGFSVGGGFTYESLSIPLVLNYIVGKKRSGVEGGIGVTGLITKNRDVNFFWYPNESNERFMAAGVIGLGYRLQSYSGFLLRANYTAVYDGLYYGKFFAKDGLFYPHFAGLSIGYTFR